MADPRNPLGPVLPPHMLGQASQFTVPQAEQANVLSALLSALEQRLQGPMALQQQAAADQTAMAQAAGQSAAEWWADPAVQAWAAPFIDNPSRLIGGLISGQNPLAGDRSSATLDAPTVSEALLARGAHPLLAAGAELFVPDPTGAGKVSDLLPLLGLLPFLRSVRNNPEALARIAGRVESPGGTSGMMSDLTELFGAVDAPHPRYNEPGVMLRAGDNAAQVQVSMIDDHTARVDNLISISDEAGRGELRQLLPLLDVADAHGVTLIASPEPFAHKRSDLSGLYRQYGHMGFEVDAADPTRMTRKPLPLDNAERKAEAAARLERNQQVLSQPRGFDNVAFDGELDMLIRSEMGITLQDWLDGTELMGEGWGREMLEQLSIPDSAVEDLMTSYRMGARPGPASTATAFPLTELGQPAIPTRETLGRMDEASAKEWLRALGVDPQAADAVAAAIPLATDELGEAQLRAVLRDAYAGATDPDTVVGLMEVFDPPGAHTPLFMPSSRLYPERDVSNLRPSSFDEVRQGVEDTIRNLESGDDSWLGRSGGG